MLFRSEGLGSGFIIDLEKGYILTNNHVVDGADEIDLKLANGLSYKGKIMGHDSNTDIAVVRIEDDKFSKKDLEALVLGDSEKLHVGAFVVALGAPFGLEASISFGAVSALGRGSLQITQMGDFVQTDAAINPGNSGGPLVNMDGKVVGINTAIFSKSGGYNGIGFAVPSNLVRRIANNLINNGKVSRGYIGVHFQALTDEIKTSLNIPKKTKGVIVAQVEKDGPAGKAGVKPWDVIVAIDGKNLANDRDLVSRIGLKNPGTKTKLSIVRDGKEKTLNLVIGTYPGSEELADSGNEDANSFKSTLGMNFTFKESGLIVSRLEKKSPAAGRLLPGDIILSVDKTDFRKAKNLKQALSKFKKAISQARDNKQKSVIMRIQAGSQRNSPGFAFVTIDLG